MNNIMQLGNNGNTPLTMSSLEIAELVESKHRSVKRTIERLMVRGLIAQSPLVNMRGEGGNSRTYNTSIYQLEKRDSYVVVAQLSPEFTARLVDYWQDNENRNSVSLPNFSDPIEAAKAWIVEAEARKHAEQTKAQIGSRREATAMNKASQAVKEVKKLKVELDQSKSYATVKRVEKAIGAKFPWRPLMKMSNELDLKPAKVPDQNYGEVNAYHADVWGKVYGVDIANNSQSGELA